jgi:hypothetical protein
MRKDHYVALFLAATVAVASAVAYAQGSTEEKQPAEKQQAPPPRPTWVDADGKVIIDAAPSEVRAVGSDGKNLKDAKGSDKMVPSHINTKPPPPLR